MNGCMDKRGDEERKKESEGGKQRGSSASSDFERLRILNFRTRGKEVEGRVEGLEREGGRDR